MENIVLLSGMDGTNILFSPFLRNAKETITIKLYDLNHDSNQAINHQVEKIEEFIFDNFSDNPITIIAESYSGLLAFHLLTKKSKVINIARVVFIGGFLECPLWLAKFTNWFDPSWAKVLPNKILGYLLFNQWQTPELITLFRQVLTVLSEPSISAKFKQRLTNITQAKLPETQHQINTPCLYLQANHDNLVKPHNIEPFPRYFTDFERQKIHGTHFLLQTNPIECWQAIHNFMQKNKIT